MGIDELSREPTAGDWLIVPNWDKFQHYKDRNPAWIKVYARLLQDPEYLGLSMAAKGLLTVIWLAYSQRNGAVSISDLAQISRKPISKIQLISLNHAGFILWTASKPLAAKKEKEKERESPDPLTDEEANRKLRTWALEVASDWQGGPSELFDVRIDDLERQLHARLQHSERRKLWDLVVARERQHRPVDIDEIRAIWEMPGHIP